MRQEECRHRRDAHRHTVHVVQQVQRVGERQEPEEGDEDVDHRPWRHRVDDAEADDDGGGQPLEDQLGGRAEPQTIVGQPDEEHQAGAEQDAEPRSPERLPHRRDVADREERDRDPDEEPAVDGRPPQERRRLLVPAILAGRRDEADGARQRPDHGRQRERGERTRRPAGCSSCTSVSGCQRQRVPAASHQGDW
jgi:hypothetical protein